MNNRKLMNAFAFIAVLIGIILWARKETYYKGENGIDKLSEYEIDKDQLDDTSGLKNGKEGEDMKKDISDRRFRDLIGEYNETQYEDLITVKYSEEEIKMLQEYFESCIGTGYTMNWVYNDLKEKYAFECVREADRVCYAMFQGEDGSLLCVYFNKQNLYIRDVGVYKKFLSINDYDQIIPGVTRQNEIYALSGELCSDMLISAVDLQHCMVKEGTLLFYFRGYGYGWTEEDIANPPLERREFIPDGEEPPQSFEDIPQMLPIDKHIAEISESENHK